MKSCPRSRSDQRQASAGSQLRFKTIWRALSVSPRGQPEALPEERHNQKASQRAQGALLKKSPGIPQQASNPAGCASRCGRGHASMPSLFDRAWSPYAAGFLIGLLQIPAFLVVETALGASSSYVVVGSALAALVDPGILRIDYVARRLAPMASNWWQVALVGGIALGALMSARLSGARREPISPIWARALGSDAPGRRYAVAFAAGFLMLFGARIADGCTSGHGLSGVAQLAVGSTVAVAAMFAGGIATAMLVLRRI